MLKIRESATALQVLGPLEEHQVLDAAYKYQPGGYFHADSYQLWRQHQARIKKAYAANDIALADSLKAQKVGWDGWLHAYKIVYKPGCPPVGVTERGHLDGILQLCEDSGIQVDKSSLLPNPFAGITIEDIPDDLLAADLNGEQWEMQKRCIHAWLAHGIGRVKVTVSGGKTAMFCAAASFIKRKFPDARFLYVTPTERLVKQVYTEACRFLPDWHVTQFGGSGRDDTGADMVVATSSILNKRLPKLVKSRWIISFIGVFCDEHQFVLSPSYGKILKACPAYFRFGASDTNREDNPELNMRLTGVVGPTYEGIEAHELIYLDRIATPTIHVVTCNKWRNKFSFLDHVPQPHTKAWVLDEGGTWHQGGYQGPVLELDEDGEILKDRRGNPVQVPGVHLIKIGDKELNVESRWCLLERKYDGAIINFPDRNKFIAERAALYSSRGWPTLVIATRTTHVLILQSLIGQLVGEDNVRILFSAHSSSERDSTFKWLTSTPGAVLISPLVKVGVSLPAIIGGVVADYVADHALMNQFIGRYIRRKPDGAPNEAEITIFRETQHPAYDKGSAEVIEKLRQIQGYKWVDENV